MPLWTDHIAWDGLKDMTIRIRRSSAKFIHPDNRIWSSNRIILRLNDLCNAMASFEAINGQNYEAAFAFQNIRSIKRSCHEYLATRKRCWFTSSWQDRKSGCQKIEPIQGYRNWWTVGSKFRGQAYCKVYAQTNKITYAAYLWDIFATCVSHISETLLKRSLSI